MVVDSIVPNVKSVSSHRNLFETVTRPASPLPVCVMSLVSGVPVRGVVIHVRHDTTVQALVSCVLRIEALRTTIGVATCKADDDEHSDEPDESRAEDNLKETHATNPLSFNTSRTNMGTWSRHAVSPSQM